MLSSWPSCYYLPTESACDVFRGLWFGSDRNKLRYAKDRQTRQAETLYWLHFGRKRQCEYLRGLIVIMGQELDTRRQISPVIMMLSYKLPDRSWRISDWLVRSWDSACLWPGDTNRMTGVCDYPKNIWWSVQWIDSSIQCSGAAYVVDCLGMD